MSWILWNYRLLRSAVIQTDMEWGIHAILGREVDADGEEHFWVRWDDTLMPRSALKIAEKLIAKFMARCQTKLERTGCDGDMPPIPKTISGDTFSEIST